MQIPTWQPGAWGGQSWGAGKLLTEKYFNSALTWTSNSLSGGGALRQSTCRRVRGLRAGDVGLSRDESGVVVPPLSTEALSPREDGLGGLLAQPHRRVVSAVGQRCYSGQDSCRTMSKSSKFGLSVSAFSST